MTFKHAVFHLWHFATYEESPAVLYMAYLQSLTKYFSCSEYFRHEAVWLFYWVCSWTYCL